METITGSLYPLEEVAIPKRPGRKSQLAYPIAEMEPGSSQSFLVPAEAADVKNVTSSIRAFAYRNNFKVILRHEATGVRVWRASETVTA